MRTKVVVRNLPPNLTEKEFRDAVSSWEGKTNYFSFETGCLTPKLQLPATAHLNFKQADEVFAFAQAFNGHIFLDQKGKEHKAEVEYAVNQKIPRVKRRRRDPKEATIYQDSEYLKFCELLEAPTESKPSAEVQMEEREALEKEKLAMTGGVAPVIVTPLIEYIRLKRAKAKEKAKRRKKEKADRKLEGRGSSGKSKGRGAEGRPGKVDPAKGPAAPVAPVQVLSSPSAKAAAKAAKRTLASQRKRDRKRKRKEEEANAAAPAIAQPAKGAPAAEGAAPAKVLKTKEAKAKVKKSRSKPSKAEAAAPGGIKQLAPPSAPPPGTGGPGDMQHGKVMLMKPPPSKAPSKKGEGPDGDADAKEKKKRQQKEKKEKRNRNRKKKEADAGNGSTAPPKGPITQLAPPSQPPPKRLQPPPPM